MLNLLITLSLFTGTCDLVEPATQPSAAAPAPAAQVSPADAEKANTLSGEGWQLWRKRDMPAALEKFREAVELDATNQEAWNGLGWASFQSNDPATAKQAFEKLIEINPKHPAALNGLGQMALTQGKLDEAEKWLLKSAESPAASAAFAGLGQVYLLQERWDDATRWLAKAKKAMEDAGQAQQGGDWIDRLLQCAKDKKLDDDVRAMLQPQGATQPQKDVQEGFKLWQKGKNDEAKELFDKALAEAPDDSIVLNGVGWYRLNTHDIAAAQDLFTRALEKSPTNLGAMNGLANCQKQQGDVDKAIETWKKMLEANPDAAMGAYGLAQTYLERGEFDKALPLFEKMVKTMPDNEAVKQGLEKAREGATAAKKDK